LISVAEMDGRHFILEHGEYKEYIQMDASVHPCAYHFQKPCVRTDGTVEFCNSLHSISASLRESGSFRVATEADAFADFYALSIGDLQVCPTCRYIQLCGGGCRGEAVTHLNDIRQPDPIACTMMPLVERIIMPVLTEKERATYRRLIRSDLLIPPCYGIV
jgi:radical SAM protein with 4Fe4S-binding SPASM domain